MRVLIDTNVILDYVIVTRDTSDFEKSPLPVYSPAEFLEILNTETPATP